MSEKTTTTTQQKPEGATDAPAAAPLLVAVEVEVETAIAEFAALIPPHIGEEQFYAALNALAAALREHITPAAYKAALERLYVEIALHQSTSLDAQEPVTAWFCHWLAAAREQAEGR